MMMLLCCVSSCSLYCGTSPVGSVSFLWVDVLFPCYISGVAVMNFCTELQGFEYEVSFRLSDIREGEF